MICEKEREALWNAVNAYAASCGGDTSVSTVGSARQSAVVAVEQAVDAFVDARARSEMEEAQDSCFGEAWSQRTRALAAEKRAASAEQAIDSLRRHAQGQEVTGIPVVPGSLDAMEAIMGLFSRLAEAEKKAAKAEEEASHLDAVYDESNVAYELGEETSRREQAEQLFQEAQGKYEDTLRKLVLAEDALIGSRKARIEEAQSYRNWRADMLEKFGTLKKRQVDAAEHVSQQAHAWTSVCEALRPVVSDMRSMGPSTGEKRAVEAIQMLIRKADGADQYYRRSMDSQDQVNRLVEYVQLLHKRLDGRSFAAETLQRFACDPTPENMEQLKQAADPCEQNPAALNGETGTRPCRSCFKCNEMGRCRVVSECWPAGLKHWKKRESA